MRFYLISTFLLCSSFTEPVQMVEKYIQAQASLPRYEEAGYSPLGRSPIVDILLADPYYMPVYAEAVAEVIKHASPGKFTSLATSLLTEGGMQVTHIPNRNLNLSVPERFTKAFTLPQASLLHAYWEKFKQIHENVETILSVLSDEEKIWIKANYNAFFFGTQEQEGYDFFTTDSKYPLKFFELSSKIDLVALAGEALQLSEIADDFYNNREEFGKIELTEDFILKEGSLTFIISQKTHVEHRKNASFFIDLGGSNQIYGNAGGTEGVRSLALHIDLKGNNTYSGGNFVQGCGFLGVGIFASCSGNNTFKADSYAQGCGFFGVGFLLNLEGKNKFEMNYAGQSCALFGASILWNRKGENRYLANDGMAQGASSTLGIAFCIESQGNNSLTCGRMGKGGKREGGIGQGGSIGVRAFPWLNNPSFYGGFSFLYLGGGYNHLKTAWLGQGSAYFLGIGIVVAEGSNDTFEADYDAQGQGLHLAGGLVLKKGDRGRFRGGWGSLGVSGDRSVGMFISLGGRNLYEGTEQSIGTSRKPKSLGVFIDSGGHNTYQFGLLSNARLEFPEKPNEWSSALFIDIGEESSFPEHIDEFSRGTGKKWGIKDHSLGISMLENTRQAVLSLFHQTPTLAFSLDSSNPTAYRPLKFGKGQDLANELKLADYERRRQIYETLDFMRFKDRTQDFDLSFLIEDPSKADEDAFNYGILWALRNKNKVNLTPIREALKDQSIHSQYMRKMAVSLLGTFFALESIPVLKQIMLEDDSDEIRYYSALSLALNLPEDKFVILQEGLKSSSENVRFAIAKGLQESKNPHALRLVLPLFNDMSFYVRRAAGLTAISLGDKDGVSVVFNTLQFETLDTRDNYGNNIFKQLSTYLGVDFGLDKEAWINWWNRSKNNFIFP